VSTDPFNKEIPRRALREENAESLLDAMAADWEEFSRLYPCIFELTKQGNTITTLREKLMVFALPTRAKSPKSFRWILFSTQH
jgi:hypothetical protein